MKYLAFLGITLGHAMHTINLLSVPITYLRASNPRTNGCGNNQPGMNLMKLKVNCPSFKLLESEKDFTI